VPIAIKVRLENDHTSIIKQYLVIKNRQEMIFLISAIEYHCPKRITTRISLNFTYTCVLCFVVLPEEINNTMKDLKISTWQINPLSCFVALYQAKTLRRGSIVLHS